MNVLLTGAFGNVGMSTLQELIRQGHGVRCFDVKTKANVKAAQRFKGQIEVVWGKILLIGDGPRCQYTYRQITQKVLEGMGVQSPHYRAGRRGWFAAAMQGFKALKKRPNRIRV